MGGKREKERKEGNLREKQKNPAYPYLFLTSSTTGAFS